MAMKKEDIQKIILEEIERLYEDKTIDEGFLDRLKAQAAGLKSTLGSTASNVAGKALGALGATQSAAELQQASQSRAQQAADQKTQSLLKSHSVNIAKSAAGIQKAFNALGADLQKIGIENPELAKQLNTLRVDTMKNMTGLISYLQSGGTNVQAKAQAPASPPSAPKAPEQEKPAEPVQQQAAPAQPAAQRRPQAPKKPVQQQAPTEEPIAPPAQPAQRQRVSARRRPTE